MLICSPVILINCVTLKLSVSLLDSLVDMVGENESHPLASLMELVSVLIENYEDAYVPEL
jgi:HTH-type transcriptional regulator/antitoxin HigA